MDNKENEYKQNKTNKFHRKLKEKIKKSTIKTKQTRNIMKTRKANTVWKL